jgi:hypothetical protein
MTKMAHHLLAGLLTCALAPAALATLTFQAPVDKQLTFEWELSWDGQTTLAAYQDPTLKYWVPVFSIVNLDGGSTYNDLDVELRHRGIGPKEAENLEHNESGQYHFKVNNILDNLPQLAPPATQNVAGSIQMIPHLGDKQLAHRDDVRLEYRRVGNSIDFKLIGVHVDSPVPEPPAWALALAGLLAVGMLRLALGHSQIVGTTPAKD